MRSIWLPVLGLLVAISAHGQVFTKQELPWIGSIAGNNGIAVADYDLDNDLDVVLVERYDINKPSESGRVRLFDNLNNGDFVEVTDDAGIDAYYDYGHSEWADMGVNMAAAWADYNNDGWPDLTFTALNRIILYHNNGDGTFSDVTDISGIDVTACYNSGAAWFDYDGDGWLDVAISDYGVCGGNHLFLNLQNGKFNDITETEGIGDRGKYTWMIMPLEVNNDGHTDLYVSNDFGKPNELWIRVENHNYDMASAYRVEDKGSESMGVDLGDFDGDSKLDMIVTSIERTSLFLASDHYFKDIRLNTDLDKTGWAWAAKLFDFDLDKDEDLLVTNGYMQLSERNYLFENVSNGSGNPLLDVSDPNGMEVNTSFSCEVFDYDNDGDLDMLVGDANGPPSFFVNKTIEVSAEKNWLQVSLQGIQSNRYGVGAVLKLTQDFSNIIKSNHGVGFLGQSIKPIHFGLGASSSKVSIEVTWPSGLTTNHVDIDPNQFVILKEDGQTEVLNIVPSIKLSGCTDKHACNYDASATINDGTCQYLETPSILGVSESYPFNLEVYHIQNDAGVAYEWRCEQCHIEAGQGTASVSVVWDIATKGEIGVKTIGDCNSLEARLEVDLKTESAIDHHSVARLWNEALLEAIRKDYARPTVHARNLFHTSVAMYDAWAAFDSEASPYFLGNSWGSLSLDFEGVMANNKEEDQAKAISYAAYRVLSHRFKNSPGAKESLARFDALMEYLGYDNTYVGIDYQSGDAAALGNYIANGILAFGAQDGSNELNNYGNRYYQPSNSPIDPFDYESFTISDPNRWQPLAIDGFIDQSGNRQDGGALKFLSPEWGSVIPFALDPNSAHSYQKDANSYKVYHDPGSPPSLDLVDKTTISELYQKSFSMVSVWGSHLDPLDGVIWDISPASIGNIPSENLPKRFEDYDEFYKYEEGGDIGEGHSINPITNAPYETNLVPRGDYARVLAEFWADGPDSETPPGHWFALLNYVTDQLGDERRYEGVTSMDLLEWDVKSYMVLGGAMHDAAIAAWGVKGWYDYIRPISAIRYMSSLGQSSDPALGNYHVAGIPLVEGLIEVIKKGDPLAGLNDEFVDKIKLYSWRGHDYVTNVDSDQAGVGWIRAGEWWPYQRPSFVTPPFAGYVSGHSTYSRAAAEVLTLLTGSPYFPGGMGEFLAKKDEFLVFEQGPSVDVKLQWATYRDASDQCSLSRIWGGIHPPIDDMPGRLIGISVGKDAFAMADKLFLGKATALLDRKSDVDVFPNPVSAGQRVTVKQTANHIRLFTLSGQEVEVENVLRTNSAQSFCVPKSIQSGVYALQVGFKRELLMVE